MYWSFSCFQSASSKVSSLFMAETSPQSDFSRLKGVLVYKSWLGLLIEALEAPFVKPLCQPQLVNLNFVNTFEYVGVLDEFGFKRFAMISSRARSGAGNCSGTVVITFRSACMQFELGLNGLWNHFATDTSGWADFLCKWFEQAICLRWVWMDFEATMQLVQVVLSDHCQVAVHRKLQKVTVSYRLMSGFLVQVAVHRRLP